MITVIQNWLNSGAEVQEGLRLLDIYAPNKHLRRLVALRPDRFRPLLIQTLSALIPKKTKPVCIGKNSFREQWSFLSDRDCPNELKILAADKISAYRNYTSAHQQLFECVTEEDCFSVAKKVVENFIENRKIHSELAYYKEHRSLLGKHPIFDEVKRLAELRALPITELFRRKTNLEEAIWRIQSELRKGNKPHLDTTREQRLQKKRRELAEVERIISGYGTIQHL